MKRKNKNFIIILIVLIILIIVGLKAFNNSKANKTIEITANFKDVEGLVSDEKMTLVASNDGENGMAIILPEIVNEKKVKKYIITKKDISNENIKNTINTKTETMATSNIKTENAQTEITITKSTETENTKSEAIVTKSTETENIKSEATVTKSTETENTKSEAIVTKSTETENTKSEATVTKSTETENTKSEATVTKNTETKNTKSEATIINNTENFITETTKEDVKTENIEKNPGEKIYLTQEELKNLEITLEINYDTIKEDSQILYNKQINYNDEDKNELLTVSGYMLLDTQLKVSDLDITKELEQKLEQDYSDYNSVRKL